MPDFLLIGAAKAGTTSLFRLLSEHPQIYTTPTKEPNFFAFEGGVPKYTGPGDAERLYARSILNLRDYQALFAGRTTERVSGEASHWYLYSAEAGPRIKALVPQVKLIAILRNPVDRAYSTYLHLRKSGQEDLPTFELAVDAEPKRIADGWSWGHYLRRGLYYEQLKRYFDLFEREKILVLRYDDLSERRDDILARVFDFLEVDSNFRLPARPRSNVSGIPRSRLLFATMQSALPLYSTVRKWVPASMRRVALGVHNRNLVKPPLDDRLRSRLTDFFSEDLVQLERLVEMDFKRWLTA